MLSNDKKVSDKKPHIYHLHEISKTCKFINTESRQEFAKGWGEYQVGYQRIHAYRHKVSFGNYENILILNYGDGCTPDCILYMGEFYDR